MCCESFQSVVAYLIRSSVEASVQPSATFPADPGDICRFGKISGSLAAPVTRGVCSASLLEAGFSTEARPLGSCTTRMFNEMQYIFPIWSNPATCRALCFFTLPFLANIPQHFITQKQHHEDLFVTAICSRGPATERM